jgi:hypothetical protein
MITSENSMRTKTATAVAFGDRRRSARQQCPGLQEGGEPSAAHRQSRSSLASRWVACGAAHPAPLAHRHQDQHDAQCQLDGQGSGRRRSVRRGWLVSGHQDDGAPPQQAPSAAQGADAASWLPAQPGDGVTLPAG